MRTGRVEPKRRSENPPDARSIKWKEAAPAVAKSGGDFDEATMAAQETLTWDIFWPFWDEIERARHV
jgi:hypothetical protein